MHLLERSQRVPGDPAEVFAFFADARNLERITPPWLHFHIEQAPDRMEEGALIRYRLRLHGVPMRWVSRIAEWDPPRGFVDVQVRGPYRHWHHTHLLEAKGDHLLMSDRVRYSLPLGPGGSLAHRLFVRRDVERIFDYRRQAIRRRLG